MKKLMVSLGRKLELSLVKNKFSIGGLTGVHISSIVN